MGFKDSLNNAWDKTKGVGKKIFSKKDKRSSIEKEIDNAVESLQYHSPYSVEYSTATENVERLANSQAAIDEAKAKLHPKTQLPPIDTTAIVVAVVGAIATIGCTMLLVAAESETGLNEIITSKAISTIPKFVFRK